jgi:hypothetical protein
VRASERRKLKRFIPCDHASVLIQRIVRAYSTTLKFRVIGGTCQRCGKFVERTVTEEEIKHGIRQSEWA